MTGGPAKYHRRNVLFLSIVEIFWGVGLSFSHARAVLPAYLADLGATNLMLGVLSAIWVLGSSVPQAFSAYFTEHLPTKKRAVMLIHFLPPLAWLALFVYNYYFVPGPGSYAAAMIFFLPVMAFYACSLGLLLPVYLSFLSRVVSEDRRGRAFGTIFSAQCIFGAWAVCCVGFLLAGRVFPKNYAFLFLLTFLAVCVGNLFFAPIKERRDVLARPRKRAGAYFRSFVVTFLRNHKLRRYVLVRLLIALNMVLVFFYVKHAKNVLPGLDAAQVRYFVVFLLIGQSSGNLVFGRLGDRVGFRAIAAAGAALMLCATGAAVALQTLAGFYLAMTAAGFYLAADWISHLNIVLRLSGEGEQTRNLGVVGLATSLPLALASLLVGLLMDRLSFAAVAIPASGLAGIGAILLLLMKMPGKKKPVQRLPRELH